MKQMKEEVSNFQKWKKEKEKQVTQLQLKVIDLYWIKYNCYYSLAYD